MNLSVRVLSIVFITAALGCPDPAAKAPKANVGSAPAAATKADDPASAPATKSAADSAVERLEFSEATSKLEFVGSKVTASHPGGFAKFSGTIELDPANLTASRVKVSIDVHSAFSDSEKLTGHLLSADFFDAAAHPEATFDLTKITATDGAYELAGTLQIRGMTKSISFPAKIDVADSAVTATAEFSINRKDFNMAYPGRADDLIRDDVLIKLNISAPRS